MKILSFSALALLLAFGLYSFNQMGQDKEEGQVSYADFLAQFEQQALPLALNHDQFSSHAEQQNYERDLWEKLPGKRLNREFSAFIPGLDDGMMSRMGPDRYQAQGILAQTKNYDLLLYAVLPPFRANERWVLAAYSKKGELIDEMMVATNRYGKQVGAVISEDCSIILQEWDRALEDDIYHYKETDSKRFVVADNGEFVQTLGTEVDRQPRKRQLQQVQESFGMR
ncbi:hypothetical protein PPO43_15175 [Saprospira sp. CCB-QB6]|uniref:hypothetical protein n=1 Tax=Saprospira sp. CCB-QB6 TaxID=3023936 RepID=UPI00234B1F39|nr:hypothetical protein [Saprospira sp. CCB-QB6]WCL81316.1 hypothetical protein PPO43_15175 [Saprospira sp. CCB-QB6]